jgi:transcriptional regulator with XRE-family HTH domain
MYVDYLEYFSERILNLRLAKNVSARKMSLDMGLNKGYIGQIESKKSLPSLEVFIYICDYFDIAPRDFFDDEVVYPTKIKSIVADLNKLDDNQLDNIAGVICAIVKK